MQFDACRANERVVGGLLRREGGSEVLICKQNILSARKPLISASKPGFSATKHGVSASKFDFTTN